MNIGIIGAGRVGGALAQRWRGLGHAIVFGARPEQRQDKGSFGACERRGLTVCARRRPSATRSSSPCPASRRSTPRACANLRGKIMMDACNWFGERPAGVARSLAESITDAAPGAHVAKAFNITGSGNMLDPRYGAQNADMFICGDDANAKTRVAELASSTGFDVVDAGPLSAALMLEHLAQLWVHSAYAQGMGPNIAWKLLRR